MCLCVRTIYEKLASAFTEELAVLYHQRVEEISPNIRYCAYNIGEYTLRLLERISGGSIYADQMLKLLFE